MMAPDTSSLVGEQQYCGLGNHLLKTPNTIIKNAKLRHFAFNINPELQRETLLCMDCYKCLEKIYKFKLENGRELRKKKQSESESESEDVAEEVKVRKSLQLLSIESDIDIDII